MFIFLGIKKKHSLNRICPSIQFRKHNVIFNNKWFTVFIVCYYGPRSRLFVTLFVLLFSPSVSLNCNKLRKWITVKMSAPFFSPHTHSLQGPLIPGDMNGSVTNHTRHHTANQIPHWWETEITGNVLLLFMSQCDWRRGGEQNRHLTSDNWKLLI